jgi:hypothetical protein
MMKMSDAGDGQSTPMKILRPILLAVASLFVLAETAQAHYDPNIGRWISRDPIGENDGGNLYHFSLNSPVTFFDFLGLKVSVTVDDKTGPKDVGADWAQIAQMIKTICGSAHLNDDGSISFMNGSQTAGAVGGFVYGLEAGTANGCCCLKQLVDSENTWLVKLSRQEGNPGTIPPKKGVGFNNPVPPGHFGPPAPGFSTGGQVFAPIPGGQYQFGSYDPKGNEVIAPEWRILGHELCGHAMHLDRGTHDPTPPGHTGKKGDRPEHDQAIREENKLAGEHGEPSRGTWDSPSKGESYRMDRK